MSAEEEKGPNEEAKEEAPAKPAAANAPAIATQARIASALTARLRWPVPLRPPARVA